MTMNLQKRTTSFLTLNLVLEKGFDTKDALVLTHYIQYCLNSLFEDKFASIILACLSI